VSGATQLVVVSTVVDDQSVAERMGRTLIEERLAACVQIAPPVSSIYRWKGTLEQTAEWGIHCKSSPDRVAALIDRIRSLHPYETPEILSATVTGSPEYAVWVAENTTPDPPPS